MGHSWRSSIHADNELSAIIISLTITLRGIDFPRNYSKHQVAELFDIVKLCLVVNSQFAVVDVTC